jgi:hypothetical protein
MSTSIAPYLLYTEITSQVDFIGLAPLLKNEFPIGQASLVSYAHFGAVVGDWGQAK